MEGTGDLMPFKVEFSVRGTIGNLEKFGKLMGAPKLEGGGIRGVIANTLGTQATFVKNKLAQTTATWETHSVKWQSGGGGFGRVNLLSIEVFGTGDIDVWNYLDKGTTSKTGRGTSDFSAKTIPGSFESGSGAGAWIRDGSFNQYGIEARGWTKELSGETSNFIQDKFRDDVSDGFLRLAQRFGAT